MAYSSRASFASISENAPEIAGFSRLFEIFSQNFSET
jgi:hypothetical protein